MNVDDLPVAVRTAARTYPHIWFRAPIDRLGNVVICIVIHENAPYEAELVVDAGHEAVWSRLALLAANVGREPWKPSEV